MRRIRELSTGRVTEYPDANFHSISKDRHLIWLYKARKPMYEDEAVETAVDFIGTDLVAVIVMDGTSVAIEK